MIAFLPTISLGVNSHCIDFPLQRAFFFVRLEEKSIPIHVPVFNSGGCHPIIFIDDDYRLLPFSGDLFGPGSGRV
jgi:hypothetical protein